MASASEHMISCDGMPHLTRLTMSVSANTPHLAATWCSLRVVEAAASTTSSAGMPTLMTHLSMVAPVPDAHLSFIEVMAVLPAGLLVCFLEDDDLGVLAAELDHRADVGVQRLDRQRDGVDLLHELGADVRRERARRPSR